MVGSCGFHCRVGSGLGERADIEQSPQKGDALAQRMVKSQADGVAPLPGFVTLTSHQLRNSLGGFFEALHQRVVKGRVAGR